MRNNGSWTGIIIAIIVIVVLYMIASLLAPSAESVAETVASAGYSNVVVTGPNMLAAQFFCSESDYFLYDVLSAVNAKGENVTNMYVCAGLLKGQTIRYK